ncbi:TPA: hypothetical protein MAQ95_001699 [Klebsiella pneumoniae]|nr:hypothetical protein [Klebsiella pneumoniae]HBY2286640.1 hypothetical protein [Klebsiella pneumoniae]HCT6575799.1 hypothetical protein [Klebsiella pneumoniae]
MKNEVEQIAQQNDMSIEFVTWFFNEKKANCGNVWFMMMAAMWEGWKGRSIEMDKLAAENVALNNFIAKSCYVQAGENASWYPAIDHAPEIPTTNQLSIEESQFLTDVITAAGLLSCGKQDKGLARRITDFCVVKRGSSNPAQLREGDGK